MIKKHNANEARLRRHRRVRKKVAGMPGRPRLSVFRSSDHIYAQIIDDERGHTLTAASSREPELAAVAQSVQKAPLAGPPEAIKGIAANARVTQARAVGQLIARRAKALGIERVVFDRGGYLYHGRIAALAHGAREGGLDF